MTEETFNPVELATELTIAWLGSQNNRLSAENVAAFLRTMHSTILALESGTTAADAVSEKVAPPEELIPAVTVRKSLASKYHIISIIAGKPYKTLRRHLSTHGLTDVQYRARYNLRSDYSMAAESYSLARREMTQKIGLGRKGRGGTSTPEPTPTKRTRRKATEAA